MKIERLSENQIRCTLNKADLTEKQLKISELAYGTPKAKELFKDMMQQASVELGFEADDTPLMIEAIPVSPDCLILIVTKVEDPEELDTRFSRFSKTSEYDIDDDDEYMDDDDIDDDLDDNDESRDNNGTIARLEISGSGSVPQGVREALEGISTPYPDLPEPQEILPLRQMAAMHHLMTAPQALPPVQQAAQRNQVQQGRACAHCTSLTHLQPS